MAEITVVVSTFGGMEWVKLAHERAIPSAEAEGVPVVHRHGLTLAKARNEGLRLVDTEWVVFLDADDELEPGYCEAMLRGTADVRGPMACYTKDGRWRMWRPRVAGHTHDCTADCLTEGNFVLVGAAVRTELLRRAGGWRDFPWAEDWDTWIRCWKAGATFELISDAIYRAHVRPDSRNRGATRQAKLAAHRAIYEANFGELANAA